MNWRTRNLLLLFASLIVSLIVSILLFGFFLLTNHALLWVPFVFFVVFNAVVIIALRKEAIRRDPESMKDLNKAVLPMGLISFSCFLPFILLGLLIKEIIQLPDARLSLALVALPSFFLCFLAFLISRKHFTPAKIEYFKVMKYALVVLLSGSFYGIGGIVVMEEVALRFLTKEGKMTRGTAWNYLALGVSIWLMIFWLLVAAIPLIALILFSL